VLPFSTRPSLNNSHSHTHTRTHSLDSITQSSRAAFSFFSSWFVVIARLSVWVSVFGGVCVAYRCVCGDQVLSPDAIGHIVCYSMPQPGWIVGSVGAAELSLRLVVVPRLLAGFSLSRRIVDMWLHRSPSCRFPVIYSFWLLSLLPVGKMAS